MTNIAKTSVAKVLVAFVAAAMIFTMFAAPAKAQTSVEDLQKMISDLMAQIAALQAGTGTTTGGNCAAIPAPLTIGAQNANVTALQNYLIAAGQSIPAGATGYFGTQTQSALAAWQAANGVAPAVGYYGPITAAAMAAKCVPADGDDDDTTSPTPDLRGGEGDLDVEILTDGPVTIDLGRSETVLEYEVEAVDSDIAINRVDFFFSSTTATSVAVRPWLYFEEVNLLVDGKEVASLSRSSDFSDQGTDGYRARFSGLNIVLREDDMADIALELVALDAMAGTRANDRFAVVMNTDGIRFVDGAGLSETAGKASNAQIDFNDVFTDGRIRGVVSDNSPESATVVLAENSRTNGVTIVNFDLEARDSDMEVRDVTVNLTASGGNVGNVFNRVRLYQGNTLLSTKTVSGATTTAVLFDKVDFMISEDDEREFRVEADFNNGGSGGSGIAPSTFTVGNIVVNAENRNYEVNTETITVGETHNLIVAGLVANNNSVSITKNNNVTTATFTFDVTAYENDYYVSATSATAVVQNFATTGGNVTIGVAPEIGVSGVSKNSDGNYRIQRGQTRTVTVSYDFSNTSTTTIGYVTGELVSIDYGNAPNDATNQTAAPLGVDFRLPANTSVNPNNN